MLYTFHGKRDPVPLQLEAIAFSETLVCLSQTTWRQVRGDLSLSNFFFVLFCFKARSHCRENRLFASSCPSVCSRGFYWTHVCEI